MACESKNKLTVVCGEIFIWFKNRSEKKRESPLGLFTFLNCYVYVNVMSVPYSKILNG